MSVPLACYDGPAPEGLADDLRLLSELPAEAQRALWRVCAQVLMDPVPSGAPDFLAAEARTLGVDGTSFARAVSAMRALYRQAVQRDVSRELFADDLATLTGGDPVVSTLLLSSYELARVRVQAELSGKALTSHGKVLIDVDWRLSLITQSSQARGLKLPLITLTLHWEEHGVRGATTYDVLPTVLKRVKDTLAQIVT
jgi:hypothetical protein